MPAGRRDCAASDADDEQDTAAAQTSAQRRKFTSGPALWPILSVMPEPRGHLSMLRSYTAADALTIGNASCGTIAIFLCLDYVATGNAALPVDRVHPAAAGAGLRRPRRHTSRGRRRARQSVLGGDLDSLADVISFGVAPAVLGFTLGLRGGWDVLCLTYLVVCGVSRLARFNVTAAALADASTGKVKYFEGTPIPTSIVIVGDAGAWRSRSGELASDLWFGAVRIGPCDPASARARICGQRQRDDQRHAARAKTR